MAIPSNPPTLSSREQFQNTIRNLNEEELHRHRRNKSISLQYNPYELQHVSSLRVSPLRKSPPKASPTSLRQVVEEPDFGTEERDIWSRASPTNRAQHKKSSNFTLYGAADAVPASQDEEHTNCLPSLLPQIVVEAESEERPKTRRGPSGSSAFETFAGPKEGGRTGRMTRLLHKGKFKEGTMTSRSSATASTWSDSEYGTSSSEAEETDSDATPKISHRRRSGSLDLREFQPPALTSSTVKRTLFGRREVKQEKKAEKNVKTKQADEDEEKKPKKRLRKSMSKLHFLGEKMKIFGHSSQDLSEQANSLPAEDEKSILDERKRKAEAAYAQQFGIKKQRDNDGQACVTDSSEVEDMREFGGNQKYDSSTVRCRSSTTRSRRVSTGSMQNIADLSRKSSVNEHDIRKRPSRRELEKENQQLRALLRESEAAKDHVAPPSEEEPLPPVPPLRIRRKSNASCHTLDGVDAGFVVIQDDAEPPVPPLPPQHPDRRILGNVSNGRTRRTRRESFGVISELDSKEIGNPSNPLQNIPMLNPSLPEKKSSKPPRHSMPGVPRSVSTIIEETGDEVEEKKRSLRSRTAAAGKENANLTATITRAGTKREEWQWPDDVF